MSGGWEVISCEAGDNWERKTRLADGWEPFAVTVDFYTRPREKLWLRRKIQENENKTPTTP